ncbi:glycosyltransferase family 2 protein [Flammeovirga kamogawensis]|uniref:Glycosyltransferase family 2 protein n=1 Tax=Flammeovirga kamogawensis TaxID=373891 RepID=A0ABX8GTN4_9BACT|nr:glycosyltransferase family 2 protein [Flammeovirga kamogawensis]MBB6459997.1 glycosyltransferase involved in cell wall biosynthesis [Flammeovirga kamogawensis]QWG06955.1 glycosyltransferase family 2 protein [Flammeovirga kamogawensis]TRX68775.1 glycosyltransferase family 2 protein [Flammeovirga kamogawensis]
MKVSVITAVYNSINYLDKYLDSIIKQTYDNIEIICVDDGSTDGSVEYLLEQAKIHPNLKVISQNHKGVLDARKLALKNATGSYFSVVDSDDFLAFDAIEKAIDLIKKNNLDAALYTLVYHYSDQKKNSQLPILSHNFISGKDALKHSLDWSISFIGVYKLNKNNTSSPYVANHLHSDEVNARYLFLSIDKVMICSGIYYYHQSDTSETRKTITSNQLGLFTAQRATKKLLLNNNLYSTDAITIFECYSISSFINILREYTRHKKYLDSTEILLFERELLSFKNFVSIKALILNWRYIQLKRVKLILLFLLPIQLQKFLLKFI